MQLSGTARAAPSDLHSHHEQHQHTAFVFRGLYSLGKAVGSGLTSVVTGITGAAWGIGTEVYDSAYESRAITRLENHRPKYLNPRDFTVKATEFGGETFGSTAG